MVENDKNHIFAWVFLVFCWVFWWFNPCQYGSEGYNFCFTHTDNHYKLDYKLLTSYAYLILTLYIVKDDKKITFSVCLGGGARLHANASYDRWECALWIDDSPIPSPLGLRQNHWVWYLRTQGVGPKAAHSHCWAWMGRIMVWGPFILALSCCK